jgi:hypothetical protein
MAQTVSLRERILDQLDRLTTEQQEQVLDFAAHLPSSLPPGTPGEVLLARMGTFEFEPGDLDEIAQAIEEGCEKIDWNEW